MIPDIRDLTLSVLRKAYQPTTIHDYNYLL